MGNIEDGQERSDAVVFRDDLLKEFEVAWVDVAVYRLIIDGEVRLERTDGYWTFARNIQSEVVGKVDLAIDWRDEVWAQRNRVLEHLASEGDR